MCQNQNKARAELPQSVLKDQVDTIISISSTKIQDTTNSLDSIDLLISEAD